MEDLRDRIEFLRTTEMFAQVEDTLLERIAGHMRERRLPSNERLFAEGELGDAVYTIVEGTIGLQRAGVKLVSRGRGECVGEFSILDGAPRSASAVAESDATLLGWSRDDFRIALQVSGGLTRGFFKTLTAKLRENVALPPMSSITPIHPNLERKRFVKEVFETIALLPPEERNAYLDDNHPGDPALRVEVAELLDCQDKVGSFLEAGIDIFPSSSDESGRVLDHYRLEQRIGSGGMGEVYDAVDTRLERHVAVKILPSHLAGFDRFRRRFEIEAKAIAALDHPNIVTIHSVEEADGIHYIVMELVSGQTLTELIQNGGVSVSAFFDIAIPLARALADAHAHGITHRDLKPDNIMIDVQGTVKVLDFGLAKTEPMFEVPGDKSRASTLTKPGEIVGTVPYMSPEQAEGRSVDESSDVFTLGVNFYELITGCYPFDGDTPTAVMASILKDQPIPVSDVKPEVPKPLSALITRCLDKAADKRYSARGIVDELERIYRSDATSANRGA